VNGNGTANLLVDLAAAPGLFPIWKFQCRNPAQDKEVAFSAANDHRNPMI
jgi:hypothetical protein